MPENWFAKLSTLLSHNSGLSQKLLWTLAVVALLLVIRGLARRLLRRQLDDASRRYRWHKNIDYLLLAVGIVWVGTIWLSGFGSLLTYLGLLSAGLAIALKDPLVNLVAWVFLITQRPFVVGDRIEVGDVRGDVVDIRFFAFTLMEIGQWVDAEQSTGRLVHVPNATIFTNSVANYTMGFQFIWHELPVLVTFESDWRKAKQILTTIINEHTEQVTPLAREQMQRTAERYMIAVGTLTPKVYTRVVDDGVLLTCRYLTRVRKRRGSEEAIWEAILDAFAQADDIDFAYPTRRLYFNPQEGKAGAGGPASPPEGGGASGIS